tara:strand:- start:355 stop:594 length:240 start_codon:yes stop_codon:yes gene_type:complete
MLIIYVYIIFYICFSVILLICLVINLEKEYKKELLIFENKIDLMENLNIEHSLYKSNTDYDIYKHLNYIEYQERENEFL